MPEIELSDIAVPEPLEDTFVVCGTSGLVIAETRTGLRRVSSENHRPVYTHFSRGYESRSRSRYHYHSGYTLSSTLNESLVILKLFCQQNLTFMN